MKDASRHEYKFLVDEKKIAILNSRLSLLMKKDSHMAERGYYQIRSVYFDDVSDTCYQKNEAGCDPRAKYRIRIYNGKDSYIKLEKKVKQNGKTRKYSAALTREQTERLLQGQMLCVDAETFEHSDPLLKQFALLQKTNGMKPKVIVIYDRTAYVEKNGNVRVTFDKNISASVDFAHFFSQDLLKHPIQRPGEHLMEVKYDAFLPRTIRNALETGHHKQETFSKYYLCRRYMKRLYQ